MAKKIFMSPDDIEAVCVELREQLLGTKTYGSVNVKKNFKADARVAGLYFTPTAWAKMTALVAQYTTEVQWHGLVKRVSESEFRVFDIIVPPHEVTGATVTSDATKYSEWINALDDETFFDLHFHGHSHVDMPVSPSATDEKYRADLITQLPTPTEGEDVYYIFLIINKKHEWSAEIYDFTNNALYSSAEIDMDVSFENDSTLSEFLSKAKEVVTVRYAYSNTKYYGGYTGNTVTPTKTGGSAVVLQPCAQTGKADKKSSKNEKKSAKKSADDSWWEDYMRSTGYYNDDCYIPEEDDPTSPFYVRGER